MIWFLLLLLLAAAVLAGAYYAYTIAFYSPPRETDTVMTDMTGEQYTKVSDRVKTVMARMAAVPFEPVYIYSEDGIQLYGRYYHTRDDAPLQILFHGYRSAAERDSCGGHSLARKLGFNILVVDQRAHGKSDGNVITFGILERLDCKCWAEYASKRFGADTPIVLSGLSMGAATVLMASDLTLPENVAGIIADSPYSTPKAIISKVCWDMHLPPALAYPIVKLGAALYGGFSIDSISAEEAVKGAHVPILLLHGEDDRFVPCQMSREIQRSCTARCQLCTFPDAGHGLCYMTDPKKYEQAVTDFLRSLPTVISFMNNS